MTSHFRSVVQRIIHHFWHQRLELPMATEKMIYQILDRPTPRKSTSSLLAAIASAEGTTVDHLLADGLQPS